MENFVVLFLKVVNNGKELFSIPHYFYTFFCILNVRKYALFSAFLVNFEEKRTWVVKPAVGRGSEYEDQKGCNFINLILF